ncbi:MAG: R3H domain-containing nucleic acid-binding protein [Myxococcota bacterium]|nr:R3H domain-containing nucleic acid-binding protein [Myxococcota bacterium]
MSQFTEAAPEGTQTVTTKGEDVKTALAAAAEQLGVPLGALRYEVDVSYFRNDTGGMVPRDDLQIIAWARDMSEVEVMADARKWIEALLGHLDIEAEIATKLSDKTCRVALSKVSDAGRLVGRRGRTVQGIEHMLNMSVGPDHEGFTFKVDIADRREREDRGERSERGERGGRDRGERGDRGDRKRGDRDRKGGKSDRDNDKLRRMAQKIIARVKKTGKAEMVRKELNGYDRRILHLCARESEGVESRSIGEGSYKQVEFYPTGGESSGEE